jgi:hypothetical protein
MGKPAAQPPERFEKFFVDGIIVWKSNSVSPAEPQRPLSIDLRGWACFGKRLTLMNAR